MADRYYNPFQNIDIFVPEAFHQSLFKRYCHTVADAKADQTPFPRMIDLWFFALCVAVNNNKKPVPFNDQKKIKIIDGGIFASDPWRIQALMLIATASTDGIDILSEPREIIGLVSGLAAAGMPLVEDMIKAGHAAPLWNLSDAVTQTLA